MRLNRVISTLLVATVGWLVATYASLADVEPPVVTGLETDQQVKRVTVGAEGSRNLAPPDNGGGDSPAHPSPGERGQASNSGSNEEDRQAKEAWEARAKAASARSKRLLAEYRACLSSARPVRCVAPKTGPGAGPLDFRSDDSAPIGASLPPEVVAYAAVAELQLTPPRPGIGPSPEINPWKMAAVGYPLWLWAEGELDPAPVSESAYDLSVSLDARLERVIFDMGDGSTVTCTTLSRRWTRAVVPGAESPVCGYRYAQPSLPKGDYTVTARSFWAVRWTVNGATGTIPITQTAATTLPVGELQALIR